MNSPAVDTTRNTKAEAEVIAFDQFASEIMPLNHSKVLDRCVSNLECEANDKNDCTQMGPLDVAYKQHNDINRSETRLVETNGKRRTSSQKEYLTARA